MVFLNAYLLNTEQSNSKIDAGPCVETKTISDPGITSARIGYLSKF